MQYISACRSRIRIIFHRCTRNYRYFSFPFCFWSQWFVLSATVPPAAKLDPSKHEHFRRLGARLKHGPEWDKTSWRFRTVFQNVRQSLSAAEWIAHKGRRIYHPKKQISEHDSNSHCCFHPPDIRLHTLEDFIKSWLSSEVFTCPQRCRILEKKL